MASFSVLALVLGLIAHGPDDRAGGVFAAISLAVLAVLLWWRPGWRLALAGGIAGVVLAAAAATLVDHYSERGHYGDRSGEHRSLSAQPSPSTPTKPPRQIEFTGEIRIEPNRPADDWRDEPRRLPSLAERPFAEPPAREQPAACTYCWGRGQTNDVCFRCKGSGLVTADWEVLGRQRTRCPVCGGSGFQKCSHCKGTGFQKDPLLSP